MNLQHDGLSTGLHLEERGLRELIMKEAKNKSFLSLMTESGTINVFAAVGGALTTEAVVTSDFSVLWTQHQLQQNDIFPENPIIEKSSIKEKKLYKKKDRRKTYRCEG